MAHPYNEKREDKVAKQRVSSITHGAAQGGSPKCYAAGGAVSAPAGPNSEGPAMRASGGKVKARADRPSRAKGGRVKGIGKGKGHKTNVNVIVAPSGGPQAGLGPKPPMPMPLPPPGPPAVPPLAAKPPMPPMPPAGGAPMGAVPPPMMRKRGGRADGGGIFTDKTKEEGSDQADRMLGGTKVGGSSSGTNRAKGGKVSAADVKGKTGIGERTPIQHSGNKDDTQNIGRKNVITKATGGAINANGAAGKQMGPKFEGGARGGNARLEKAHRAAKGVNKLTKGEKLYGGI